MHILVTNDDGPPSPQSSPYIHCLIAHLRSAGHTVSVCLPHAQRSWIGKAHMIGQTLKPTYYHPSPSHIHGEEAKGTTHSRPSTDPEVDEWVLIDGTPASCVQIGLHHFFQDKGPIDLVVSGPNYGRNTTAVFALSSGTLGAALEAAVCRQKSIALSFAFFSRNHDPVIIEAACRHSVKVIEALYKQWPTKQGEADLYSVNVPLVEGVEGNKTLWTEMLQNFWQAGSCFEEISGEADGDNEEEEERIREGEVEASAGDVAGGVAKKGHKHKHFKWAPRFADVYKSVEDAPPGNDGWAVQQGHTSVTPMKACFLQSQGISQMKELELEPAKVVSLPLRPKPVPQTESKQQQQHTAVVQYEDPYVQPLILDAMKSLFPEVQILESLPDASGLKALLPNNDDNAKLVQISQYEEIDFELAAEYPSRMLINSYMIRKALIRKHFLTNTIDHWVAKHPESVLGKHVKRSEHFEVDYAEFLDDALVEAFDLRESMERNEAGAEEGDEGEKKKKEWWILKPGMSDRGQGIRLFSTMEELQGIFDEWEEERPDSDDDEEEEGEEGEGEDGNGNGQEGREFITTSHLRHFVAQPYIDPPLLINNHKFHIRTYVLCVGSLSVYVYTPMLALFAAKPYSQPTTSSPSSNDIEIFLTNTCRQTSISASSDPTNIVKLLSQLPSSSQLSPELYNKIVMQIREVTGELFEAAAKSMAIHFQTLPNGFEVYGLDYLVDEDGEVWLLEVNAFPDFKQTGGELKEVVGGFWRGVVRRAIGGWVGGESGKQEEIEDGFVKVKEVDLGRR